MSENSFMIHFHWAGDAATLQRNYDDVLEKVVALRPTRPMVHLAYPVEDGFEVVDVWNNEQIGRELLDNPDFQERLETHGLGNATIRTSSLHRLGWPVSQVPAYR